MNKTIKNYKNINYGPAPEDAKDVLDWINNLTSPNHNFINGSWVKATSKKTMLSINPSTNKKLYDLTISSKKDVDRAVKAANNSFSSWSKTSPFQRSKYLYAGPILVTSPSPNTLARRTWVISLENSRTSPSGIINIFKASKRRQR